MLGLTATLFAGSLWISVPIMAEPAVANTQPLPTVWVGGPNPAPCYRSVKLHRKWVSEKVACYEVKPPTIALTSAFHASTPPELGGSTKVPVL